MTTGPHTVVLGLGASGESAARLLRREGGEVTVLDAGESPALRARAGRLEQEGVRVRLGAQATWPSGAEACVVSPGVPLSSPWVSDARAAGVRCVSELELGWSRMRSRSRVMAVTGSNGKSTLVKWLAEAIAAAGQTAQPVGNYGVPVSRVALEGNAPDWLVLEVSSFQLETVSDFRPDIGIVLNILPNHLDRHGTMSRYRTIKSRLFSRMRPDDVAVVPARLRRSMACRVRSEPRWITFGTSRAAEYRWNRGRVCRGETSVLDVSGTWVDNEVLGPSAAAAAAALSAAGLPVSALASAACRFQPLPHRMEPVAEYNGLCFVDDSKATSLAALAAAVRRAPWPVRLIAGGLAKGESPGTVKEMLANRCRAVYLIGRDAERLAQAWSDAVPCKVCGTMTEAFFRAVEDAVPGEGVLLSPGCASFDQFDGFEDRGAAFKKCVRAWIESERQSHRTDAAACGK